MANVIIFYEDGRVTVITEPTIKPNAAHYPPFTRMFLPYSNNEWFECAEYTYPRHKGWELIDAESVPKRMRTIALIHS